MSDEWKAIADSILATVKEQAKDFLDQNQDVKALLEDRAKRLAELSLSYIHETDPAVRVQIQVSMDIVQQTIVNEVSALALNGQTASIAAFKATVATALGALVKYLPVILAHV